MRFVFWDFSHCSLEKFRSLSNSFQSDLFMARDLISFQVYPTSATSAKTFHCRVFDGITLLRLTWGFHWNEVRLVSVLRVWPIFLLHGLTSLMIAYWSGTPLKSCLKKTRRILRRHPLINDWNLCSSLCWCIPCFATV